MNICLLNDSFPPVIDGVANVVMNYGRIMQEQLGAKVVVGTPRYPGVDYDHYPYQVVPYPSIDTTKFIAGYRTGNPLAMKQVEKMARFAPDIIHTHCPAASTIMARVLARETGAPIVFTYHTKFDVDISRALGEESVLTAETIKAMVSNISACDEVWVVSQGAGENLKSLGYEGDYRVVSNGVDFARGRADADQVAEATKDYDLPADVPMFLFVGRIMKYKGLPLIIDAMEKLTQAGMDYRCVFVGGGADAEEMQARTKDNPHVIFTGPIHDREVLRAWNTRADLFLFPSTYDTNGIVVREAAACGLASVLIKGSCAAEGITDGRNGYLIEDNADSMAELLQRVCRDMDRVHDVGQHAMDEIYISWDDSVRAAYERYGEIRELVAEGKMGRRPEQFSDKVIEAAAKAAKAGSAFFSIPRNIYGGMMENVTELRDSMQENLQEMQDFLPQNVYEFTEKLQTKLQEGLKGVWDDVTDLAEGAFAAYDEEDGEAEIEARTIPDDDDPESTGIRGIRAKQQNKRIKNKKPPEDNKKDWYKRASFYQIWTRSFADGNGDGIGDLYGVYDKLEYVKSLGVDGIWFSPLYPSPNADYGYDISDYRAIHPDFGTMEQFKMVLDKAHSLGLKVIMDLVVNHTSDEHPWFKESRKGKNNPYSDYYIWRDKPNNWDSLLEGKAWEYDEQRGQYYLHLFSKKQPDLNMDNPRVREEVKDILRFWLDMGVDGFREDVINFISKKEGLPNNISMIPFLGDMLHYKDGPHIHVYMQEFRAVCEDYGALQIGEGPMTTVDSALTYLSGPRKSLDMMFSFDHMMADCFYTEYLHHAFDLKKLKRAFTRWQTRLEGKAWNALYLENHDHPRVISRYGSEHYHRESGTMLAAAYLFQQGTPFIYQGQEIGMTNIRLKSIEEYKDVSSKNNFRRFHVKDSLEKRLNRIHVSSRDSARTPMQWNDGENAGFSTAEPWFSVNPNYRRINVEAEEGDKNSILNFYRRCLELRRYSRTLIYGSYKEYQPGNNKFYIYERAMKDVRYLILCSFAGETADVKIPAEYVNRRGQLVLGNYDPVEEAGGSGEKMEKVMSFRPYETRVYRFRVITEN